MWPRLLLHGPRPTPSAPFQRTAGTLCNASIRGICSQRRKRRRHAVPTRRGPDPNDGARHWAIPMRTHNHGMSAKVSVVGGTPSPHSAAAFIAAATTSAYLNRRVLLRHCIARAARCEATAPMVMAQRTLTWARRMSFIVSEGGGRSTSQVFDYYLAHQRYIIC